MKGPYQSLYTMLGYVGYLLRKYVKMRSKTSGFLIANAMAILIDSIFINFAHIPEALLGGVFMSPV